MKRLLVAILFVLLYASPAPAVILVCDVPSDLANLSGFEVSIDGVVVPAGYLVGGVWTTYTDVDGTFLVLLDEATMAGLEPGRHDFIANGIDVSGWPGDWSSPLNAGKPGTLGSVKVKNP